MLVGAAFHAVFLWANNKTGAQVMRDITAALEAPHISDSTRTTATPNASTATNTLPEIQFTTGQDLFNELALRGWLRWSPAANAYTYHGPMSGASETCTGQKQTS
jgi:hypothetical protein